MQLIIHFLISFVSTVGFGIITNIPRRALPVAGLTGALAWSGYIAYGYAQDNVFIANMIAAMIIGLLGNIFAVKYRVPVNMIYIPSLVSPPFNKLQNVKVGRFFRKKLIDRFSSL